MVVEEEEVEAEEADMKHNQELKQPRLLMVGVGRARVVHAYPTLHDYALVDPGDLEEEAGA